ncbi:hypothetical protein DMENIID0001_038220 [Sergentomyia squamirostris]
MAISWGQLDIIGSACEDLTEYLEIYGSEDDRKIKELLARIVRIHQDHTKFMGYLDAIFSLHSCVMIVTGMICQVITIYAAIGTGYLSGILMFFVFFWQIFTICLVGGVYVIKLENLQQVVTDTKWYLMPWRKQRMFVFIMHTIQNIPEPTAIIIPLNINTFVSCTNTIYNYVMMLMNFSNKMAGKQVSEDCYKLFTDIYDIVYFMGFNVLADVNDKDFPPNWRTYFTISFILLDAVMTTSSISAYITGFDDLLLVFLAMCMCIQAMIKTSTAFWDLAKFRECICYPGYFASVHCDNQKARDCLQKFIDLCNWIRPYTLRMYVVAVYNVVFFCLVVSYWTGTRVLPLPAVLPFLDYQSDIGYFINFVVYFILGNLASYGFFTSDSVYLASMAMAWGQLDIIAAAFEDLTEYLEIHGSKDEQKINDLLARIIKIHKDHTKYMGYLGNIFNVHSAVMIITSMIFLPILDYESDIGYAINYGLYLIMGHFACYGFFTSDYAFLIGMAMAWGQLDIIGYACEDLTEYLEIYGPEDDRRINECLAKIIRIHQDHIEYMGYLGRIFNIHSAVMIVTSMICQTIALYAVIETEWMSGISLIFLFIWEIFTICIVGGIYVIKLEQLQKVLINTKWYVMPWQKQKMFVCITQTIQNIPEPTAIIIPLNINTFVTCMKTMYQYLMILLNVSN